MEFVTTNGNVKVKINIASFKDVAELKKAALKALQDVGIIKDSNLDIEGLKKQNPIKILTDLVINIDTSKDFEDALFACLKCCIYDVDSKNLKITPLLFDDIIEAREDYYEIAAKCVEVNLSPFFKSLVSACKTRLSTIDTLSLE